MKEIYQQTVEEVLERVNGKKSGLTSEQVKRSREKCGWNELTEGKKKGILQIFFEGAVYFPTAPFLVFCIIRHIIECIILHWSHFQLGTMQDDMS